MRLLSKIAIAGVALALVAAMVQPVMAGCPNDYLIATNAPEGVTFIYTPGHFTPSGLYPLGGYVASLGNGALTTNAEAFWWQLAEGDPAFGVGLDNGTWGIENWIKPYNGYPAYSFYYGSYIQGGWGQDPAAIDGCIADDGVVANECMCVIVTDEFDGQGYGAIFGASTTPNGFAFINVGAGQVLFGLPALPTPTIVGSSRDVNNDLTLQVSAGGFGANDFSKDGCNCAGAMQFKVYTNTVMRNSAPPVSRDAGWVQASPATPMTDAAMVNVACGASNVDVYVSTSLVADSGFETEVSANSTRVECGPSIANPDDLQELRPGRQTPRAPRQGRTR